MTYTQDPNVILAGISVPLVLIGGNARVMASNSYGDEIFGAGLIGRHYVTAFRYPVLVQAIESAFEQGQTQHAQYDTFEGAREVRYRVEVSPVALADGQGLMVRFDDVTELQEIGQMRRDFVANVSHELRTPLTALLGFIETLRGPAQGDPKASERFLSIMDKEATRMNRLVDDLLSLSRVESNERIRPREQFDVLDTVKSAALSTKPFANGQGVVIALAQDIDDMSAMITGDQDQLHQVFSNLITNAVKYGGADRTVTISVTLSAYEGGLRGPGVVISVRDEGDGIEPHHIPRLTERFYRVDGHRSREMGGTGLGLAIVKHIVNRHRGRLRVESKLAVGSVFSVILPLNQ